MKKLMYVAFVTILALNGSAAIPKEPVSPVVTAVVSKAIETKAAKLTGEEKNKLVSRLKEIRDMDKSNLTKDEKRELRKEVTVIKDKLHSGGVSIYLSATAIIIILLLIILL